MVYRALCTEFLRPSCIEVLSERLVVVGLSIEHLSGLLHVGLEVHVLYHLAVVLVRVLHVVSVSQIKHRTSRLSKRLRQLLRATVLRKKLLLAHFK